MDAEDSVTSSRQSVMPPVLPSAWPPPGLWGTRLAFATMPPRDVTHAVPCGLTRKASPMKRAILSMLFPAKALLVLAVCLVSVLAIAITGLSRDRD